MGVANFALSQNGDTHLIDVFVAVAAAAGVIAGRVPVSTCPSPVEHTRYAESYTTP
jgi:hypothetical protein